MQFMELKASDARHATEMEEVEEELEAMQLENKQLFQELEFARKDLEIAETRTEELKQLYEKELMGSSQVILVNEAT
jgi:uncharacterized protein (DUF3084 family)